MSKFPAADQAADLPSPLSPSIESRPGLLRVLGPWMAVAIVVGNVIGSGIFAKPGRIAADAGDFGLIITAWIVAGVICLMGALCFAELAVMLPRAGGMYVYLREAYSRASNQPEVRYHLAVALDGLGRTREARSLLQGALDLQKDFEGAADARRLLESMPKS